MKVSPFHTNNPEEGQGHRDVYHDNDQCSDGKRILPANKAPGQGNRNKCDECKTLS